MFESKTEKIKNLAKDFFEKMTITPSSIEVSLSKAGGDEGDQKEARDVIDLKITLEEPQILIGQGGQTLFEIQRILKNILNKSLQDISYLNLDINDYKKNKITYLENLAKELADEVSINKTEKSLPPMNSYERRIIHAKLSERTDIISESQGEGLNRHIVIKSK